MSCDYTAIKAENERRYGTDIGRIGPMLLANRYDDRTHFIFELLQNAEDALARRKSSQDPRSVGFVLSDRALHVSHYGAPFTDADVRGICGIAESTKDLTTIGRFGIGFKSVYAFTDRPEVHSGSEHFAIESFVWPEAIESIDAKANETAFILPLRDSDSSAPGEIAAGLQRLGPRTLLFLREIEEISWSVEGGRSGLYMRSKPEQVAEGVRKVLVVGQEKDADELSEETWLVCSRQVRTDDGQLAGHVEIAFALESRTGGEAPAVQPIDDAPLVVFFPTVVQTNMGFLVQGPYRTTPSRDNVPRHDPWNQHLVRETGGLLLDALRALRSMGLLSVQALATLPIDRSKFGDSNMFAPLFELTREALAGEALLPSFGDGHAAAENARLARTQELRELLDPIQLGALLETDGELTWLSEEITQDRTPELRRYLINELDISELEPATIVPLLTKSFLESQSDVWIVQFYEFLHGQTALLRSARLRNIPIVRLESGAHVTPQTEGQPQAFLPGPISTGFPTVKRAVCESEDARAFLLDLGMTEPDPVDDVVRNILPKYQVPKIQVSRGDYEADIQRILNAFETDSKSQRDKLVSALKTSCFVISVDAGTGSTCFEKPTQIYIATQRFKDLFEGVPGVLLVDDSRDCLRGESIRELLEACGASRYLAAVPVEHSFSYSELLEMRTRAGAANNTGANNLEDVTLRGLPELLEMLPSFDVDRTSHKTVLLWEALCDVEDRRGSRAFVGTYNWFYFRPQACSFDASFVRVLNQTAWIPDEDGQLHLPSAVVFDELGDTWKPNPLLLSKIRFKPPAIDALASEVGIEPGVLDLLKKLGVTSETQLRERLGIDDEPELGTDELTPEEAARRILGDQPGPDPPSVDDSIAGVGAESDYRLGTGGRTGQSGATKGVGGGGAAGAGITAGKHRSPVGADRRHFISYVAVHPDDEPDPDGATHEERMALEEQAIGFILDEEPALQRTSANNPGFDLFEPGPNGKPVKWIEVKAMTGDLKSRPVGLTRSQFHCAHEHGTAYWLYVVECVGSTHGTRIVRIQDPEGKSRTFTFDQGWINVAEVDNSTPATEKER